MGSLSTGLVALCAGLQLATLALFVLGGLLEHSWWHVRWPRAPPLPGRRASRRSGAGRARRSARSIARWACAWRCSSACAVPQMPRTTSTLAAMTVLDFKPVRLGAALRRWRLLNRIKQTHAAELFGVAQSTISRWESGVQEMEPAERAQVERRLSARLDAAADRALARLVDAGPSPMHLVCDLSHALLACSPSRAAEFGAPLSGLMGRSLWRYATPEIQRMEAALEAMGWRETQARPPSSSAPAPIARMRCRSARAPAAGRASCWRTARRRGWSRRCDAASGSVLASGHFPALQQRQPQQAGRRHGGAIGDQRPALPPSSASVDSVPKPATIRLCAA